MPKTERLHENLERVHTIKRSSDRSFGIVFAGVFLFIGLWPLLRLDQPRWWALAVAVVFLLLAWARPRWLAPLNKGWALVGLALHRVVNPLVMGAIFYIAVAPTGYIMRWLGKDPLRIRWDKRAESYWIERTPPGPAPDTMKNQF